MSRGYREQEHACRDGRVTKALTWWEHDAQGIPLARVCETCRDYHLSRYRPEILSGYDQNDVDEPIEPEEG